jgi:hypothetical protein
VGAGSTLRSAQLAIGELSLAQIKAFSTQMPAPPEAVVIAGSVSVYYESLYRFSYRYSSQKSRCSYDGFGNCRVWLQLGVLCSVQLCVLLGVKPSWAYSAKLLLEPNAKSFLTGLKPHLLHDEAISTAGRILRSDDRLMKVRVAHSKVAATKVLYAWLLVMTDDTVDRSIQRKRASMWDVLVKKQGSTTTDSSLQE